MTNMMFEDIESNLKAKYEYLLSQLQDTLGLATNMSGNLECILSIIKTNKKINSERYKIVRKNFLIIEDICQLLGELINQTQKLSFTNINIKTKNDVKSNVIVFPFYKNEDI